MSGTDLTPTDSESWVYTEQLRWFGTTLLSVRWLPGEWHADVYTDGTSFDLGVFESMHAARSACNAWAAQNLDVTA